jgi:ribosomal protein S15P/S13E
MFESQRSEFQKFPARRISEKKDLAILTGRMKQFTD